MYIKRPAMVKPTGPSGGGGICIRRGTLSTAGATHDCCRHVRNTRRQNCIWHLVQMKSTSCSALLCSASSEFVRASEDLNLFLRSALATSKGQVWLAGEPATRQRCRLCCRLVLSKAVANCAHCRQKKGLLYKTPCK